MGRNRIPTCSQPLLSESDTYNDTEAALRAWSNRSDAEFALLGANRPADGYKPPRIVWACPLGPLTDPTPGADQVSVVWRSLNRKSKVAAQHLRNGTDDEEMLAIRCATNAVATAKWAVNRDDFAEHAEELKSWADSLETATQTRSAEWIGRLSEAARHHEQQQCGRSKARQYIAWKNHFRHGESRLADGFAPTRRAFQFVRGPMGWTQAPVAPASVEDDIPEVEMDHHDEHLVRAAVLYQEQSSTLTCAVSPSTSDTATVLSP